MVTFWISIMALWLCKSKTIFLLLRNALLRGRDWVRSGRGVGCEGTRRLPHPLLTVFPRVANGDLGLGAFALAVDGLDLDLIGHKGGGVGHHQEGIAHDLFLPSPLHPLRAPLDTVLNLGGVPVHPPEWLQGVSRRGGGQPRAAPSCDPASHPQSSSGV